MNLYNAVWWLLTAATLYFRPFLVPLTLGAFGHSWASKGANHINYYSTHTSTFMENVNIYAVLATWKKNKSGLFTIHINIDIDGKRAAFPSLKKRITIDQWDATKRKIKNHPNATVLNQLIKDRIAQYEGEISRKQLDGVRVTKTAVKRQVKGADKVSMDFYRFCQQKIDVEDYAKETRATYLSHIKKMKEVHPALYFNDIDYTWLQKYENYMRTELSNHPNTIWKSFKFLNTMLNAAIKAGVIKKNPFEQYDRGKYRQGIPVYLEWKEAQVLHDAIKTKPLTEFLRTVGYYALLSYYSGLRFGDSVSFDYDKKVMQDSTGRRLVLYTNKTGEIVSIGFNKYISEIVDALRGRPIKITNQEFNRALKQLQGIADIKGKDISSHAFRHGFAMRCAELGMSIDEVQKLMGHTKRETTEIYFKIKDKRLDASMMLWEQEDPK